VRRSCLLPAVGLLLAVFPRFAIAQTQPPPRLEFGGYVQTQYENTTEDGVTEDRVLFRRIMLDVTGRLIEGWLGRVQADLAPATESNGITVKDAWLRYTGFEDRGLTITIGNQKLPYSRSVLTSSSRRGLVERLPVGDRAFGSPGRALSIKVDGQLTEPIRWSAVVASVHHRPDADQIRLDGRAEAEDDWNQGLLVNGRIEWHPRGTVPLEQSAFDVRDVRYTVAAATYYWNNDGDRNLYTDDDGQAIDADAVDLQDAFGFELSGAMRAPRTSLDVEFQRVSGHTVDGAFTAGIYAHGSTRLYKSGIEAGYMVIPARLELLAGFGTLAIRDRDAVAYQPTAGVAWYLAQHRLKFQIMHREDFNAVGISGDRARATFVQAQFVF
jgi:phosphate-selective porin OprO and OprP